VLCVQPSMRWPHMRHGCCGAVGMVGYAAICVAAVWQQRTHLPDELCYAGAGVVTVGEQLAHSSTSKQEVLQG